MRFLQQWLHEGELFFQQTIQRNSNAFRLWHSRETEILLQHLADAQYLRTHFAQEDLTFVCRATVGISQRLKFFPDQIKI